jgi:hypothetical protein
MIKVIIGSKCKCMEWVISNSYRKHVLYCNITDIKNIKIMIDLWTDSKENMKKYGKVILYMDLFDRDFKRLEFKFYKELLEDSSVNFFIITPKRIILDKKLCKEVVLL